jgi:RNA polymerase sigma-70 factor (ECF subfamily)
MDGQDELRLSRIKTHWAAVLEAHHGEGDAASATQQALLMEYYGAVYRYLLGALGDAATAEELTQEFAVRFLRGDFRGADPTRGRFRDFLKVSVRHLMLDYWRARGKDAAPLPDGLTGRPADPVADHDRAFLEKWREELLAHAWKALEGQTGEGQSYYAALRVKTEHPELRSAGLAELLGARLGRPVTEEAARQLIHRARQRFADLLVAEVARSVAGAPPEELEQELIDLDLMAYCRAALRRRGESA